MPKLKTISTKGIIQAIDFFDNLFRWVKM